MESIARVIVFIDKPRINRDKFFYAEIVTIKGGVKKVSPLLIFHDKRKKGIYNELKSK